MIKSWWKCIPLYWKKENIYLRHLRQQCTLIAPADKFLQNLCFEVDWSHSKKIKGCYKQHASDLHALTSPSPSPVDNIFPPVQGDKNAATEHKSWSVKQQRNSEVREIYSDSMHLLLILPVFLYSYISVRSWSLFIYRLYISGCVLSYFLVLLYIYNSCLWEAKWEEREAQLGSTILQKCTQTGIRLKGDKRI